MILLEQNHVTISLDCGVYDPVVEHYTKDHSILFPKEVTGFKVYRIV